MERDAKRAARRPPVRLHLPQDRRRPRLRGRLHRAPGPLAVDDRPARAVTVTHQAGRHRSVGGRRTRRSRRRERHRARRDGEARGACGRRLAPGVLGLMSCAQRDGESAALLLQRRATSQVSTLAVLVDEHLLRPSAARRSARRLPGRRRLAQEMNFSCELVAGRRVHLPGALRERPARARVRPRPTRPLRSARLRAPNPSEVDDLRWVFAFAAARPRASRGALAWVLRVAPGSVRRTPG